MEDEQAGKIVAVCDEGCPYYCVLGGSILKGLVESFNTLRGVHRSFLAIYLYFYFGLHAVYSNRIAHAGLYYKRKLRESASAVEELEWKQCAFSPADREEVTAMFIYSSMSISDPVVPKGWVVFGSVDWSVPVKTFANGPEILHHRLFGFRDRRYTRLK
jgi:hypothetical protein